MSLEDPNAFDAAFNGQPLPGEDGDTFLKRRQKLADLGALGPANLPQSRKEMASFADDAARVQRGLADDAQRQQAQAMRDQERATKEAERATKEAERATKAAEVEATRAAKQAQATQIKQFRESGIEIKTGDDGTPTPDTHADGRWKYKPDMIGDPYLDEESGRFVRDYRDQYGAIKPVDLEDNGDLHTDAQTGERYYKGAGGLRVNLGVDNHFQKREAAKEELDRLRNEGALRAVDLDETELANRPIKDEWTKQQRDTAELRKKLEAAQNTAKLMDDPVAKERAAKFQAEWDGVSKGYESAKQAYEAATAKETALRQTILDGKRRTLEITSDLDKLKSRWNGRPAATDTPETKAQTALEAVRKELNDAQDAARTLSATGDVVGNALSTGATPEQVGELKAYREDAVKAVSARIKEARAKEQRLVKLNETLAQTNAKIPVVSAEVQKRINALTVEEQKLLPAVFGGKITPEAASAQIEKIRALKAEARKPLDAVFEERKGALNAIGSAFDDPAKWEKSPERGLALAEVEKRMAEAQTAGVTAAESAMQTLQKSPVPEVEGKPVAEQIATLKAELERRNKTSPRADFTAQIAMLETAAKAREGSAQRDKAFSDFVAGLVAARDKENAPRYFQFGDGVIDASWQIHKDAQKRAWAAQADPNMSTTAKILHTAGNITTGLLGGAMNLIAGQTIGSIATAQAAEEARQMIGNLSGADAEKAMRTLPELEDQWKKTGSVLTAAQLEAAGREGDAGMLTTGAEGNFRFGKGAVVSLNRTLYGAEKLIKELQAEKAGAIGDVAMAHAVDAFLVFSSGKIEIDESDPQQVAQRTFLRYELQKAIEKHAPNLTMVGAGLGSLASFMAAGGIARGGAAKLGMGAKAGTIGTGALMGIDQSLKEKEGNIGVFNRLADAAFKGTTLMLSERIGDAFGHRLESMLSNVKRIPGGLARFTGRAVGGSAGEMVSDFTQNAMEGRDALEGWEKILRMDLGLGFGMAFLAAAAEMRAKRIGGKPLAPAYEGARQAYDAAKQALDAAKQEGDAAKVAIAEDAVNQAEKHFNVATVELTRVPATVRRAVAAALGVESMATEQAIEENNVLQSGGVALGRELADVYLPGNRRAAALSAVKADKDFSGEEGAPLAEIVVDQHVGAAVARDLASIANGTANLETPKLEALARLGLVEMGADGRANITGDAVVFLPQTLRNNITTQPEKYRVSFIAGNETLPVARRIVEQGLEIIRGRVTTTTTKQGAKMEEAVAAAKGEAAPATPATPTFTVTMETESASGKGTSTTTIAAATEDEAKAKAKSRAEKTGKKVTKISAVANAVPEQPKTQGGETETQGAHNSPQAGSTPAPATNSQPSSESNVAGVNAGATKQPEGGTGMGPSAAATDAKKAEKPKDKPAKPKAEKTPKPLIAVIGETVKRMLASEAMAKSLGGLNVKVTGNVPNMPEGRWIMATATDNETKPYILEFNIDRAHALLADKNMTANEIADYVESAMREELIHFAQFESIRTRNPDGDWMSDVKAHYAKLWSAMDAEQKKATRSMYGNDMEPWQMGAESVRQMVQLAREGKTTETVTEWLRKHYESALAVLRKLLSNPAAQSEPLRKTVAEVEQILADLEKAPSSVRAAVKDSLTAQTSPVAPAQAIANPDGVADVAPPAVASDVASKEAFQQAVAETNAQAGSKSVKAEKKAPLTDIERDQQDIREAFGDFLAAPLPVTHESAPFFSQLTRTIATLPQETMTVQQARAAIEKGAKKAEIEQQGIFTDPLSPFAGKQKGDKVTRKELLDYSTERAAKVEDVVLGGRNAKVIQNRNGSWRVEDSGRVLTTEEVTFEKADFIATSYNEAENKSAITHFSDYQLPGADEGSYREMFVTWPVSSELPPKWEIREVKEGNYGFELGYRFGVFEKQGLKAYGYGATPEQATQRAVEYGKKYPVGSAGEDMTGGSAWRDGHSQYGDITNPIVRIRRNIRTDADGKRAYFVEEIQGPNASNQDKMPDYLRKRIYEIGMKRALRDAVDEGADAIAWTTGEQQAERYDLGKHVDSINYGRDGDTWTIQGIKDGDGVMEHEVEDDRLEDTVGKEVAKKMRDGVGLDEKTNFGTLSGIDLKVGGEGLKSLYDRTLVSIANDLGKKFGGKVSAGEIQAAEKPLFIVVDLSGDEVARFDTKKQADTWVETSDEPDSYRVNDSYGGDAKTTVHSLPITAALKAQQAQGNALFAPLPMERGFDDELPVDRLAQIVALSQSLVARGVKTPEALAERLSGLGPKAVGISQRLWLVMSGFGAKGPLQPDWSAIYAPEGVQSEQSSDSTESNPETKTPEPAAPLSNPMVSVTMFDARGRLEAKMDMKAQDAAAALRGRIAVLKKLKECIHA